MSGLIKIENLKELIIEIRDEKVLLDSDLAQIYGVETKRINEAVKNNPDKFPQDYMFELNETEFAELRSKFSTTKFAKTRVFPKAFSEKGLYMLATILRSQQAIDATFASIINNAGCLGSPPRSPSTPPLPRSLKIPKAPTTAFTPPCQLFSLSSLSTRDSALSTDFTLPTFLLHRSASLCKILYTESGK